VGVNKSKAAFRTIAEVADELGVGTHVLRFWETKFPQIKPMKASGGRRYYRPDDVEIISHIKNLLHNQRYTIEGVQKLFREKGLKAFLNETIQEELFKEEKPDIKPVGDDNLLFLIKEELQSVRDDLEKSLN